MNRTLIFHNIPYEIEQYIFSLTTVCYLNDLKKHIIVDPNNLKFWKGKYKILKLIAYEYDIKKQGINYVLKQLPVDFSFHKFLLSNHYIYQKYIHWFSVQSYYYFKKLTCKSHKNAMRILLLDFIIDHKSFIYSKPVYKVLLKSMQPYVLELKEKKYPKADFYIENLISQK